MSAKVCITLALICLLSVNAFNVEEYVAQGFTQMKQRFGGLHVTRLAEQGIESIIHWPFGGLGSDPQHIVELHDAMIDSTKNPEKYDMSQPLLECQRSEDPGFFKFLPTLVAQLNPANPSASFSSPCFGQNTMSIDIVNDNTVTVTHKNSKSESLLCGDGYLFTTISNYHLEAVYTSGTHKFTFTNLSPAEMEAVNDNGIFVFRFCDKLVNELPDFLKTLLLFVGGLGLDPKLPFFGSKPTEFQIKENVRFIKDATGYQWEKRPNPDAVVELDHNLIRSGDFLAITRLDGLDQIIEWGAGSHAGHSTMALWVDGELYVTESQAAWYWPRKGLQMNPFSDWVQWAHNADFQVTWLPLTDEASAQFNATAAYEWFQTVEGMPYGYHNFIFGWIDTPNASYPALLSPDFLGPLFAILEKISPVAAECVLLDALNMRLGTTNLTVAEVAQAAYDQGMTMPELFAQPEQDGWWYPDGYSMVCSSFVIAMWKAGGLFDGYTINAVEFTPRDIYQMTFINPNPTVPENCKAVDPTNPYCQFLGVYRMQFPGISTVAPYDHMNEHCPSLAPDYARTPGC